MPFRSFAFALSLVGLILSACSSTDSGGASANGGRNDVGLAGSLAVAGTTGGDASASAAGTGASVTTAGGPSSMGGAPSVAGGPAIAGSAGAPPGTGADAGSPVWSAGGPALPKEPVISPACTTLTAQKTSVGFTLAEADEKQLDTDRIQKAIDACEMGKSVRLALDGSKAAFVSAPLTLRAGVELWVDKGVTLYASRNPRDYDTTGKKCGEVNVSGGCKAFITVAKANAAGIVGEGAIDGRGREPMLGGTRTWWDVAAQGKATDQKFSNPRLVSVQDSANFLLYKISIYDAANFHVVLQSDKFVVWGVNIVTPSVPVNSLGKHLADHTATNTDGIDPSGCAGGVIAYSYISVGDDQIAIKGSNGGVSDLTIAHNRLGTGHGMSIGSETYDGVKNVTVFDMGINGSLPSENDEPENHAGLRIKSSQDRGGVVDNITYEDVCIRDLPSPIFLNPNYAMETGTQIPSFTNIHFKNVRYMSTQTSVKSVVLLNGFDASHRSTATLSNVIFDDLASTTFQSSYAELKLGPEPVNFTPTGRQVEVMRAVTGSAAANPCLGKFSPLPVRH